MSEQSPAKFPPGTTVLICDDNASMRSLLTVVLNSALGMSVVGAAADGKQAIAAAEELQPDVILLDLAMPVMSGLDALPVLRRVAPAARVVVLSGFATAMVGAELVALGATSYLEKGASPEAIVETIRLARAAPSDGETPSDRHAGTRRVGVTPNRTAD